jgi:hypothetical protein
LSKTPDPLEFPAYTIDLLLGDNEPASQIGASEVNATHMTIGFFVDGGIIQGYSWALNLNEGRTNKWSGYTWLNLPDLIPDNPIVSDGHGGYTGGYLQGYVYNTTFYRTILVQKAVTAQQWSEDQGALDGLKGVDDVYSVGLFNCIKFSSEEFSKFTR